MMQSYKWFPIFVAIVLCQHETHAIAQESAQQRPALRGESQAPSSSGAGMTLQNLEQQAAQHNPTLVQAEANIRAVRGRAKQAGLMPNPVVGYQGEEFAFEFFDKKSEHYGFVEQTIPLGGKLAKARRIYLREAERAEIEALAQRQRIVNTVRALFYDALGAQMQVELQTELSRIAHDAVTTTTELFNVGQADRSDNLQSQIEAEQVDHELQTARNHLVQTWQLLASVVGTPDMPVARLEGSLDDRIPSFDENQMLANLLQNSPQIRSAQARIEQAKAVLIRAKAEPIPNLFLRGAMGDSTEFIDTNSSRNLKRTGPEANMQVGMTLPIWNRNQGAIATARADLAFAEADLNRLRLQLRAHFAQTVQDYKNAFDAVQRYRSVIVPRADEAYQLYLTRFKEMGASYPQVIISQRTMFQVRKQYINALVALQQNSTQLEGFLLTGALNAPQLSLEPRAGFNNFVQHAETEGVRSGTENGLDTSGLIEY